MSLTILYQDAYYVAIDKPAGLLVHRSPISTDRVFALQTLARDQLEPPGVPGAPPGPCDLGVLVLSLSAPDPQADWLHSSSRAGSRPKGIPRGRGWSKPGGTIDHPVADGDGSRIAQPRIHILPLPSQGRIAVRGGPPPTARYSLVSVA